MDRGDPLDKGNFFDLASAESLCRSVRSGDRSAIDLLSEPYLSSKDIPSLLGRIIRGIPASKPKQEELLAAHESLLSRGYYRESITPLEDLLAGGRIKRGLKETALCRAANAAISHEIPLDLRPILSELGMTKGSVAEARSSKTDARRGKDNPIVGMEKAILRGLLLNQNASMVESGSVSRDLLLSTRNSFREALLISESQLKRSRSDEERDLWTYHRIRCLIHGGTWLLSIGEHTEGISLLGEAYHNSRKMEYPFLLMLSGGFLGTYLEDAEEGLTKLDECLEIAGELGNETERGRMIFSKGLRICIEAEGSGDPGRIINGAQMMIRSAGISESSGNLLESAEMRIQAGIWLIRGDESRSSQEQLKKAKKVVDRGEEEELYITLQIALIYSYFRSGERRRSVKALLDLLYNNPVKQYPGCFNLLKEAVQGENWLREDSRTREMFEGEVEYTIEREAVREIIQRAKEAYPNEFGAMLRGIEHITHIEPVLEGAGGRSSFMFSLFSRFTQRSIQGEGVVHSHPSGSARPSRADLSMFGRFPGINIIIGHPYIEDSMAAYDRLGNRVKLNIVDSRKGGPISR